MNCTRFGSHGGSELPGNHARQGDLGSCNWIFCCLSGRKLRCRGTESLSARGFRSVDCLSYLNRVLMQPKVLGRDNTTGITLGYIWLPHNKMLISYSVHEDRKVVQIVIL